MPAGTALVPDKTSHPYLRIVDFRDGGIDESALMYVPAEVFPAISRYTISPNDIYVSIVGTIGLVGQVPPHLDGANLTENAAKVTDLQSHVSPEYLRYYLQSPEGQNQIRAKTVGSTQPKLALFRIEEIEVPIPSLSEQREITSLLRLLEARLALLRQTNATLESIAQALFKSWFIDFDPVRAKAEGREPEGMDAATAALFPAEFEESALGLIPRRWSVSSLAEQCAVQIGGVWGEEAHTDKASVEVCCLRGIDAVELAQGDLPVPPVRWVSPKQIESRRLRKGDILIEGSGSFCGRSLLWVDGYKELMALTPTYSNFVKRVSAPSGPHYARWIQRHLDGVYQSGEVKNYRTGSAFPNLDLSGMLSVIRVMPPVELLLQFDALMQGFDALKVGRIQQAASLAALRDTLLPRLISGKLRVPEAQAQLEEAIA